MKYNKNKINKKGFTLVEILMVIAIIGILMGVVLVSTSSVRERSEVNSLMKTMGTIVRAAGACDEVDYINPPSGSICDLPVGGTINYPALDPKLSNKGYSYGWSTSHILVGLKDGSNIIYCYVGSGSCEKL